MQALYGRNGESPAVVIAASTPTDCFDAAYWAGKLALEHMTPVILLTDASPNDSRRIPPTAENPLGCAYEDAAGVTDTAAQVRTLQRQGVRVSAVFMGEDSSAGAATQIYGKNMARIRGMDQLARAAGRLIQNEIRELGD
jgi:hypothetical protein